MELLDTHVLLWLRFGNNRLGRQTRYLLEQNWAFNVAVSAITFWEIKLLQNKNRLDWKGEVSPWRQSLIKEGLIEIPMDGQIGIRAAELPDFHGDPADRQIVATALEGNHRLITADRKILRWPGPLNRFSAAR